MVGAMVNFNAKVVVCFEKLNVEKDFTIAGNL